MSADQPPVLTRERCMQVLQWKSYVGFTDEQLRAAVHNREVLRRWGPQQHLSTTPHPAAA